MTSWLFPANNEGWSTVNMAWSGADGSPDLGCMLKEDVVTPFKSVTTSLSGLSIPVTAGAPISFRYRVKRNPGDNIEGVTYAVKDSGVVLGNAASGLITSVADTGWVEVTGTIDTSGTVDEITIVTGDPGGPIAYITYAAIDSVYLAESPSGPYDLIQSAGGIPDSIMVTT